MYFRRIYHVPTYLVIFFTFSSSTHLAYWLFSSFLQIYSFSVFTPPRPHPLPPFFVFSTKFLLLQQLNIFILLSLKNLKTLSPYFHNTFITPSSHFLLTQHWLELPNELPNTPIALLSHYHGVKVPWSILVLTCQIHLVYL